MTTRVLHGTRRSPVAPALLLLVGVAAPVGRGAAQRIEVGMVPSVPVSGPRDAADVARRARLAPWAAAAPSHRSPLVAGVLGIVPGLGHVYAGEPGRGALVAVVYFGSALVAFGSENSAANYGAGAVFLGSAVFSIVDGAAAARRHDRRHTRTTSAGSAAASPVTR